MAVLFEGDLDTARRVEGFVEKLLDVAVGERGFGVAAGH
jgi:hypothetical protein